MIPNAIEIARELAGRLPQEREEYYERAGLPSTIRAEVEALLSGPSQNVPQPLDHAGQTVVFTGPIAAHKTFIGRYEVLRLLGRGGMAEVFLAHDPVLDREVAVKLIRAGVDDPGARQRLVQEARAAGRLRHPNIVTLFDAGEHEGSLYIAMEHLGGETLRSLIHRRAELPLARRLELIEGACAGLAHAHRANVVHFDVKPDNLMLDTSGVVKVLDFGIARVLQSEVLVTQSVVGTLRYMSPEQISGGPLDRRCDVFSVGCSLFELITYKAPYVGSTHELVTRIAGGPVPRMSNVVPSVDSRLDALVARAMALDPANRFDDLDELGAALGGLRRELDRADAPVQLSSGTLAKEGQRARRPLAAVGVAALAVAGAAAFWIWTRSPEPATGTQAAVSTSPAIGTSTPPITQPPTDAQTKVASKPEDTNVAVPRRQPTSPVPAPASSARVETSRQPSAVNPATPQPQPGASIAAAPSGATPPVAQDPAHEPGGTRAAAPPAAVTEPPKPVAPPPASVATNAGISGALPNVKPPAPPQAPPNDTEVRAVLRRYEEAYRSMNIAAVQQVFPGLSRERLGEIRESFQNSRSYQVSVVEPSIDIQDDNNATVRAVVKRSITPRVGTRTDRDEPTEFRLRREGRGWVITDVRSIGGR